jgi:DnaK suppressor protein
MPSAPGDEEIDLAEVRETLARRHRRTQQRLDAFAAPPERGSGLSFGKRVGDGTLEAVSRMTDAEVGATLEPGQERVARALAKLDDGTYGTCDACGGPIGAPRLRAAPESVLCIACARRAR